MKVLVSLVTVNDLTSASLTSKLSRTREVSVKFDVIPMSIFTYLKEKRLLFFPEFLNRNTPKNKGTKT